MRSDFTAHRLALGAALALALAPAGAAQAWHLPWHHPHSRAAPAGVPGLTIHVDGAGAPASAAAVPQSWERNTLLVDLTHLGASGSATLTPPPNAGWPARLAFRVQPGSVASVEVAGAQRVQFTLPTHGTAMTLRLDPGVYLVRTPSLTLRWSAVDGLPR